MPEKANPVLSPKAKLPVQRKNDPKPVDPAVASPAHTQAALENPATVHPSDILALQKQYGNQTVQRLIQRKVTVGAADDPLEAVADRMADKVMNASPAEVRRSAPEEDELQTKPAEIHRIGEEEEIQTKPQGRDWRDSFDANGGVEDQLRMNEGGGSPLPGDVRGFMETRFSADFSNVRVHTDGAAASLNHQVSAQAFTHGSEIYMGEGKYSPDTTDGKRLLAHELTHTLQQGGAQPKALKRHVAAPRLQRYPADTLESGDHVKWEKETASAKRSSSGKTGVWFFSSPVGPLRDVVIKPNYTKKSKGHDALGSQMMASVLLDAAGISNPNFRPVTHDEDEGQSIKNTAKEKGAPIPENHGPLELAYIAVMGKSSGTSIQSASEKAGNQGRFGVNQLLVQLRNPQLLNKIGQLIAVDTFMGNQDRIKYRFANIGNIMYEGQDVVAIDNDSAFEKLAEADLSRGVLSNDLYHLDQLLRSPQVYTESFIHGVRNFIEQDANNNKRQGEEAQETLEYFDRNPDLPLWHAELFHGIQQGVERIKTILATKKDRMDIKLNMNQFGDTDIANWDTLRIRQKFLELHTEHPELTEEQLSAQMRKYLQYRERRARRMKGLKWTAKLF